MIDLKFPEFRCDVRNFRVGLLTDELNLHGNMSSTHSKWLVVLTIYNLSPYLCKKCKFIILSLLISGSR